MKLTEICLVNTWSERFSTEGKLSLLHVNDTVHVIEYKDDERSIAVDIDIVELRTPDNTVRFTFPRGSNDKLVFRVDDEAEFSVLCKAKEDCQAICDLKLRLNSILRDAYYSGMYSNLDPDAKINLCDEMERLKKENPGIFFSSLLNVHEMKHDTSNGISNRGNRDSSDENAVRLADVGCIYCDKMKSVYRDTDFVLHPNVSQTTAGKPIFLCSSCVENWKEFRDNAEHEGLLILPEEVNEEICAVCSDTPESLILCGTCSRSFCSNCLLKILTPAELKELDTDKEEDWICLCCVAGQSNTPLLARSAWKMVMPGTGRKGITHGSLTPYTKKNQAKGAVKSSVEAAVMQSTPLLSALAGRLASPATAVSLDSSAANHASSSARNASKPIAKIVDEATLDVKKAGRVRKPIQDFVDELDPLASFQALNKVSSNNRGKRMEKRQRDVNGVVAAAPVLDEKYYFGQYVGYYNLLCEDVAQRPTAIELLGKGKGKRKLTDEIPTDDVCFLCKDGGDLIECDWKCPSGKNGERCLKVYHTYCLDFEVSEADGEWCCPRHYCDMCGNQTLKYICKYCPVSICANCPEKIVSKYGHARYCEVKDPLWGSWCHSPTAPGVQSIVCQTCTEMLEVISSTAVDSINISSNSSSGAGIQGRASVSVMLSELKTQKRFPGHYEGGSSGGGSVFRKEQGSTSDDRSVSEPFVFSRDKVAPPIKAPVPGTGRARHQVTPSNVAVDAPKTKPVVSAPHPKPKGSYRRWSDTETAALRAAVHVHGDDAEAIKNDEKFAAAFEYRNAEAIWNKILREDLVQSEKHSIASDNETHDLGENEEPTLEPDKSDPEPPPMEICENTALVPPVTPDTMEDTSNQEFGREVSVAPKDLAAPIPPLQEEAEVNDEASVLKIDEIPATIVSEPIAERAEEELPAPPPKRKGRGRQPAAKVVVETPSADDGSGSKNSEDRDNSEETPAARDRRGRLPRESPLTPSSNGDEEENEEKEREQEDDPDDAIPMVATRNARVLKAAGRSPRTPGSAVASASTSKSLGKARPTGSKAQHDSGGSNNGEEEEVVSSKVSTRITRRQEEQQVLSTRSGKKLFLTGNDLLPSLG